MFEVIAELPSEVTLLFIEHDMDLVFRFAERITVLVAGRVLMEGTPDEIANDDRVREIYLGERRRDGRAARGERAVGGSWPLDRAHGHLFLFACRRKPGAPGAQRCR